MKNTIYILSAFFALLFVSCSDYLDKEADESTTLNYKQIFSDVHYAAGFLDNAYNHLPDGYSRFGGAMLAEACDEAVCSNAGAAINLFNKDAINTTTNPDDVWDDMYRGIRKCNIFLKELDPDSGIIVKTNSIVVSDGKVNVRDYYKGQALFLRAFFHFELLKRYGRIFCVDKVLNPYNENEIYNVKQSTYDEAVEFIVKDCDAASALMPTAYPDDSYKGRPISYTPLALKSRVLLYAASPLNNPSNDKTKWKRAADAAKVLIGKYSLTTLSKIFTEVYNAEVIFAAKASNRNDIESYNYPVSYQGSGYMSPTEDLVSAFGMTSATYSGRLTGYDAADPYSLTNTKKREDRLRYTVFYNKAVLKRYGCGNLCRG